MTYGVTTSASHNQDTSPISTERTPEGGTIASCDFVLLKAHKNQARDVKVRLSILMEAPEAGLAMHGANSSYADSKNIFASSIVADDFGSNPLDYVVPAKYSFEDGYLPKGKRNSYADYMQKVAADFLLDVARQELNKTGGQICLNTGIGNIQDDIAMNIAINVNQYTSHKLNQCFNISGFEKNSNAYYYNLDFVMLQSLTAEYDAEKGRATKPVTTTTTTKPVTTTIPTTTTTKTTKTKNNKGEGFQDYSDDAAKPTDETLDEIKKGIDVQIATNVKTALSTIAVGGISAAIVAACAKGIYGIMKNARQQQMEQSADLESGGQNP